MKDPCHINLKAIRGGVCDVGLRAAAKGNSSRCEEEAQLSPRIFIDRRALLPVLRHGAGRRFP
jgi:hypothetical protein